MAKPKKMISKKIIVLLLSVDDSMSGLEVSFTTGTKT
jgi:hypothetical protein